MFNVSAFTSPMRLLALVLSLSTFACAVYGKIIPKKLSNDYYTLELKMPNVQPMRNDEYFCTATNVSTEELYITRFDPNADSTKIHHIIIFGCSDVFSKGSVYPNAWSCASSMLCPGMRIIYAWGRNAPPLSLPKDVGFHVGTRSEVKYLVLQAHYATPLSEKDSSGVSLMYTLNPLPYVAGIFLMASSEGIIPPHKPKTHLDVNCALERDPINVFAYRVHAHSLGTVISAYKYTPANRQWHQLAKGNPQWPQAFYPMRDIITINRGDLLFARCTYNSTEKAIATEIGSSSSDEMCNAYLMFYYPNVFYAGTQLEPHSQLSYSAHGGGQEGCGRVKFHTRDYPLPVGNDDPLPRNLTMEESAKGQNSIHHSAHQHPHHRHYESNPNRQLRLLQNTDWPFGARMFGQVTAIDVDEEDNIVIFHRGKHVWNAMSFSMDDKYQLVNQGPIPDATIVILDPNTQQIVDQWASNLFYLPHGLTIDRKEKAVWLTDVAMHQVMKYSIDPKSSSYRKPVLTLGERFVPGKDMKHFCKPTSVAVDYSTGDFYVADGYCNSRIMRFNSEGVFQNHWGHPPEYAFGPSSLKPEPNMFLIPHKIVLVPPSSLSASNEKLACVADRENGRIQCFSIPYGYFKFQIRLDEFNGRLFSVSYSNTDRTLYAVAGPSLSDPNKDVLGFAFNVDTQQLKAMFAPNIGTFSQPHDIAVSNSGESVYVVEIGPNNIWMFSQGVSGPSSSELAQLPSLDSSLGSVLPAKESEAIVRPSVSPINSGKLPLINNDIGAGEPAKDADTEKNVDFKFNFELLRIRSRQLRNSLTFNSILYFTLFALFLFIIILHYRYSSPHYSLGSFCRNFCCAVLHRDTTTARRQNNSSIAERMDMGDLFHYNKTNGLRRESRKGFTKLAQNESEVIDTADDDDDDDLSDVLEDFNPNASLTKNRLV